MSIRVGTFVTAELMTLTEGRVERFMIHHAKCMAYDTGVIVTFYASDEMEPDQQRTLVLSHKNFISFCGIGPAK